MNEILFFDYPLSLGLKVKLLRISRCMSQEQLAEIADVSQETISRLERNLPIKNAARQRLLSILDLGDPSGDWL